MSFVNALLAEAPEVENTLKQIIEAAPADERAPLLAQLQNSRASRPANAA
jgi:hypothetical protein